ncbi:MAG: 2-hydroxyglutaryl-CoA dehydratase [Planctomycetota bacterium]|nr:MAG: 2-hydroxyglutaryl-CoA dehydratase [Planctomycetota bacterium]
MHTAGIDVGSTQTKCVVLDENGHIRGRGLRMTGADVVKAGREVLEQACAGAGIEPHEVLYTVGTGYGRFRVAAGDDQVTEIGCHARGAACLFPDTRTILDIGGQDTKAIRISERGEVVDFCMNDKCAAGTGRFLAASAEVMGLDVSEIGPLSLRSTERLKITNVCTVFVESEILNQLSRGRRREDILAGVHRAIAGRSASLIRRVGDEPALTFTGGVARNPGMVAAVEERLGRRINVSADSQYIGALGAAIFAMERALAGARRREAQGARP